MNQIKYGAVLSYFSILITLLISLIYTPIVIRLLGQSEYGLYSMIGSISAYLSILDLGLGNAMVRFTARNRAIGNSDSESKLNGMFLILYSIIGLITIVIGIFVYNSIDNVFGQGLSSLEIQKAKIMVIILIINFSLSFPLSIFGSIMQAYEKFVVLKMISLLRSTIIPLFTLPFLFFGFGSITMVLVSTLVNIGCLFYNLYYCFTKLKIKIKFTKIQFGLFKEVIGYSFFIFLGVIVDQINWNTGQIILGAVSGTAAVAIFAIAIQFIKIYLQFSTSISGLFLPRVSMMVANNADSNELSNMMIKVGRIQYIIMALILTGFILFGYEFIGIWAGKNYYDAYYMSLIIMIPITVPLIQNFGLSILQAKNLQGFRSIILILIGIMNVAISIPLAHIYQGIGVAIGTGLSYLIGNALVMNIYYYKKIGLNIPLFWKNILLMSIPVVFSLAIGFLLNNVFVSDSIFMLFFRIITYSIIYFLLMWLMSLNNYEKNIVKSMFRTLLKIVNKPIKKLQS